MHFTIQKTIEILERTPYVLEDLLLGLSDDWTHADEGENTFSPYDVVGHLIHAEKTNWIQRMNIILSGDPNKAFTPFDRFAHYKESQGKSLTQLLDEFKTLRQQNLVILKVKQLSESQLKHMALHPDLGKVSLSQLLSTWTVHDLTHIGQIVRVMAKHYKEDVGPWVNYLSILSR